MQLWLKSLLGLVFGLLFGVGLPEYVPCFMFIGDVFLKLIKMVIPFIIFFAVLNGVVGQKTADLKSIGMQAVTYYVLTTIFAVFIGIVVAHIMQPSYVLEGVDVFEVSSKSKEVGRGLMTMSDFILSIIPGNIFQSFIDLNILHILFFSIVLGLCINNLELSECFKQGVDKGLRIFIAMILYIMELSPYAIFVFFASLVSGGGIGVLSSLSYLLLTTLIAMFVQYVFFGIMLYMFTGLSPFVFYYKSLEYQLTAFATSSTKATLPVSIKVARDDLGMSEVSASVVLPMGASINMDGIAIYLNILIYFFAKIYGIEFMLIDYIRIVFATTIACIGGAGLPGGTIMMLPMVFSLVGLPIEGIPLVIAIDRMVDLMRTVISITGDVVVACIIDSRNNTLDKQKYYS